MLLPKTLQPKLLLKYFSEALELDDLLCCSTTNETSRHYRQKKKQGIVPEASTDKSAEVKVVSR